MLHKPIIWAYVLMNICFLLFGLFLFYTNLFFKMLNTKTHNKSWVVNINKGCPSCLDSLNPRGTQSDSLTQPKIKTKRSYKVIPVHTKTFLILNIIPCPVSLNHPTESKIPSRLRQRTKVNSFIEIFNCSDQVTFT